MRLDHYLKQKQGQLNVDTRLELLRQITEAIAFAHHQQIVHRGLCPQSILVWEIQPDKPQIKLYNWQVAQSSKTTSEGISVSSHFESFVDAISTAYFAPESLNNKYLVGEYLDLVGRQES